MIFGDEDAISWPNTFKVLVGAALGLIPGILLYLQKKREQAPILAGAKQRIRSKDQTLEQAMQDHLFGKYQTMLENIQTKVDKLEKDHLVCQTENATLKERSENQANKIIELKSEIERLSGRVEELEAQSGGV